MKPVFKAHILSGIIIFFACFMSSTICYAASGSSVSTLSTVTVPVEAYELEDGSKYDISEQAPVEEMSFGKASIGSLTISGNINDTTSYNNVTAYGVEKGSVSFSYVYDGSMLDTEDTDWHLIDDNDKKFGDRKLSEKMKKGLLIIQRKPFGSDEWEDIGNPIVNVLADNPNGLMNFYTTDGSDLANGCYYRITLAYRTKVEAGKYKIGPVTTFFPETITKKNVEQYTFFACMNNGVISIHNLSASIEHSVTDEYSLEVMRRAETLTDGATTVGGFSIDKLGSSYDVSVNGRPANDGARFTANGLYTINVKTKLGREISHQVYVFNGNSDHGVSTYFNNTLVQGERVFRDGQYPTYAAGAKAVIKPVSNSIPSLTGTIKNISTDNTIVINPSVRSEQVFALDEGTYKADLYSGEITSGTVFHYTFNFIVIGEDSKPSVNYNALMNADRLCDLNTKHYEVAYQTTAGGYIFVCFENYDDAFAYAYEIEKRFIEIVGDNLYYKSAENENVKERYETASAEDRIRLTGVINYYARQNVEIAYFNASEEFSYRTLDNEEMLQDLEALSLDDSVKIFPSEAEKQKLRADKTYLNDFKFMHVEDYDVVSVEAQCKNNGKTYLIEFNTPIEDQLTVSSEYIITETNEYGNQNTYSTWYLADNATVSVWTRGYNGQEYQESISESNSVGGKIELTGDYLRLDSISNEYDENAMVTIKAPGIYTFDIRCLASELQGLTLYKRGQYQIIFSDIVGHEYKLIVNITGMTSKDEAISGSGITYSDFYNDLYLNDKDNED